MIEAGTVAIGDSDAGTGKLYNALNQKPGSGNGPAAACIRVTYSGSLASSVKLYRSAVANGSQFHLKVERGGSSLTGAGGGHELHRLHLGEHRVRQHARPVPDAPTRAGIDGKAAGAAWSSGDSVDYRFTIYTVDDTTPNAHTSAMDTGATASPGRPRTTRGSLALAAMGSAV